MCGACGIFNIKRQNASRESIKRMMLVMKHRGPNDEGIFIKDNIGLGHIRLSIIDLSSAGHQPMFDLSSRYCIVHNGEIYNYLELKQQLSSNYPFVTHTYTEVILYAYQQWRAECLHHFNGMFAFAIYDIKTRTLFIARDRFGIKLMYYYYDKNRFIFASEIRSILQVATQERIPNDTVIFDYLVFNRTDQYTETFFKNIKRLGHGSYALIKDDWVSFHK